LGISIFNVLPFTFSVMTQYIIQNDNEQYMVSFSNAWSSIPENAKAFSSREAAAATLRKVNHYYRGGACWIARLVRD